MTVIVVPQSLADAANEMTATMASAGIAMGRAFAVALGRHPFVIQEMMPLAEAPIPNRKKKHHAHLIEQHIRSPRKHRQ